MDFQSEPPIIVPFSSKESKAFYYRLLKSVCVPISYTRLKTEWFPDTLIVCLYFEIISVKRIRKALKLKKKNCEVN